MTDEQFELGLMEAYAELMPGNVTPDGWRRLAELRAIAASCDCDSCELRCTGPCQA
jgi:hypothetical protein